MCGVRTRAKYNECDQLYGDIRTNALAERTTTEPKKGLGIRLIRRLSDLAMITAKLRMVAGEGAKSRRPRGCACRRIGLGNPVSAPASPHLSPGENSTGDTKRSQNPAKERRVHNLGDDVAGRIERNAVSQNDPLANTARLESCPATGIRIPHDDGRPGE
jgi:hypothetical protein